MDSRTIQKQRAAEASLDYIENGMVLGLGTGSTSEFMVRALGKAVDDGLAITGLASSERTAALARAWNIPLTDLETAKRMDLYIDGADEIDPDLRMIKGGGGALLREKILAHNAERRIIIVDAAKRVERLGAFPLPVEVIPFAAPAIFEQLTESGLRPALRIRREAPYRTDEGNHILDLDIREHDDLPGLNTWLLAIPGIVETGLFLNYVDVLLVGTETGVERLQG